MSIVDPAPRRVLILDDDAMVGMLIETVARLDGVATRLTAMPDDFFAALDSWQPTHIVLDLTMPALSGEAVLQALAQRGCAACLVISSGADVQRLQHAAAQARAQGLMVAGTLSKPFVPAA
ncbi:MAG: response regulator, partial [Chitinophagaceae bacterium]|nr:response regulator [Rubrivivax sp.]